MTGTKFRYRLTVAIIAIVVTLVVLLRVPAVRSTLHLALHAMSGEEAADVTHVKKIDRKGFQLTYPGNWELDTRSEDYDPDVMFSIHSPGSAFCLLIIFGEPRDAQKNVDNQLAVFRKSFPHAAETAFKQWGAYSGIGMELRDNVTKPKGGVRLFSHSTKHDSFVVVQYYFAEGYKDVQPGFALIEKSFAFRGAQQ